MTPREKFIRHNVGIVNRDFAGFVFDAMHMASTHDPDHAQEIRRHDRWINRLFGRVGKLERKYASVRKHS